MIAFTDDDCRPRPQWLEALLAGFAGGVGLVQGRTVADPSLELRPLSRTQWTPAEFGLYETCNIAYRRAALDAAGPAAPHGPFDLGFADQISGLLGRWFGRYPFGEDTELGWRVKRAGADSRFAVHAVVEHHVFPPDPALQIRRGILSAGFPLLLERVPELREVFLWHRYVLGSQRLRVWAAFGGLGLPPRRARRRRRSSRSRTPGGSRSPTGRGANRGFALRPSSSRRTWSRPVRWCTGACVPAGWCSSVTLRARRR